MIGWLVWIALGGCVGRVFTLAMRPGRRYHWSVDVAAGVLGGMAGGAVPDLISGHGLRLYANPGLAMENVVTAFVGAVVLLAVLRTVQ